MDFERFVKAVHTRSGLSLEQAKQAAIITLSTLSKVVHPDDRARLAERLPEPLRSAFASKQPQEKQDLEAFFSRVSMLEGVLDTYGREHAIVVCQVLAESLNDESLRLFETRLPETFAVYLRELREAGRNSATSPSGIHQTMLLGAGETLGTGRLGSRHPIGEAKPLERAHSASVLRSENPHEDRKLSSGKVSTDKER